MRKRKGILRADPNGTTGVDLEKLTTLARDYMGSGGVDSAPMGTLVTGEIFKKELQEEVARLKRLVIALYDAGDWVTEESHEKIYMCVGCSKALWEMPPHEDDCPVAAAQAVVAGRMGK